MNSWPKHPVIYEINAWVWLGDLIRKHQRSVNLATVLPEEWDRIASGGFDAVWFMGVWERSPAGIAVSMRNPGLLEDFRTVRRHPLRHGHARPEPHLRADLGRAGRRKAGRRLLADNHPGDQGAVAGVKELAKDWKYDVVSIGYPGRVLHNRPVAEPHNLFFLVG